MADISGYWEFHRACPSEQMTILNVDAATGALVDSSIENGPIHGHYNSTTNAISFNDSRFPGEILHVSTYTGFVLVQANGAPCAMAGTYHELVLTGRYPNFHIETIQSGFYALWQGPIIG